MPERCSSRWRKKEIRFHSRAGSKKDTREAKIGAARYEFAAAKIDVHVATEKKNEKRG